MKIYHAILAKAINRHTGKNIIVEVSAKRDGFKIDATNDDKLTPYGMVLYGNLINPANDVEESSLRLCTMLTDSNDELIFDDDVVEVVDEDGFVVEECVVIYDTKEGMYCLVPLHDKTDLDPNIDQYPLGDAIRHLIKRHYRIIRVGNRRDYVDDELACSNVKLQDN